MANSDRAPSRRHQTQLPLVEPCVSGFATPVPHDVPTLEVAFVKTKLDWIWLRGLRPTGGGVARHVDYSDHSPVWVDVGR